MIIKEVLGILSDLFLGMIHYVYLKIIPTVIIPLFAFGFGLDNGRVLSALIALVLFDFLTGIISAYKNGDHIESRKILRTAIKLCLYGVLVSGAHITEVIVPSVGYIEMLITTFLALTEFISILENVGKAGFAIPQKLLNKLQEARDQK